VIGDAGLIVPPADHIALSNAVESFIDDRRRAEFAARARRRAGSEYSASTYVSRLEEALERGIERRERVRTVREAR
jgi:glycosyltransferase involved in cell wall biosynthesis